MGNDCTKLVFREVSGKSSGDQNYRISLHLPENEAYDNIIGNDMIGDYRKPGVDFQPIESRGMIDYSTDVGRDGVIYYDRQWGTYMEYINEAWAPLERDRIKKILDDKAYIDMPNRSTFWFLNPRQIYFGVRLSFNFN